MNEVFRKFAEKIEHIVGTPWAFIGALTVLLAWGGSGPFFGFSEHWQLVINSFTTIATFLMVFLIQNTQNRDFKALHIKLDELIRSSSEAHPALINLQDLSDEELDRLERAFQRLSGQPGAQRRKEIVEVVRSLEKSPAREKGH